MFYHDPFQPPSPSTSPMYTLFSKESCHQNLDLCDPSFCNEALSSIFPTSYYFSDYTISLIGRTFTFIVLPSFIFFILYNSLKSKFIKSILEDGVPLEDDEFYYV